MTETVMPRRSLLISVLIGMAVSEAVFAGVYGWLRFRYSFGIDSNVGLWWPVILVAVVGAMLAILVSLIQRNPIID